MWLAFLASTAAPERAMSLLELDGYLTGVIVTPSHQLRQDPTTARAVIYAWLRRRLLAVALQPARGSGSGYSSSAWPRGL